jgi:4-aminobutyrate aminotransferase-like enzyme
LSGKWDETIFNASDVNAYQDATNILAFSDSRGTKGNFVQDVDGNVLLDLCGTESLPLGHNHNALTKKFYTKEWDHYVVNAALNAG